MQMQTEGRLLFRDPPCILKEHNASHLHDINDGRSIVSEIL